ncbi:MAG: mechanosensitive ion channel domain-containing protein [archaeon]
MTIGDEIEVNGKKGIFEDINLRTIRIRNKEGILHIISNDKIKDFSNYSQ